jgi:hypothetical protein
MSGGSVRDVFFTYDSLRRLQRKDTPEGVLTYTYTADNQVQTVKGYRRGDVGVNEDPEGVAPASYPNPGGDPSQLYQAQSSPGSGVPPFQPQPLVPDIYLTYGYDSLGRLATVTDNKLASPNVTTYHYDDVGNLDYFIYPNGLKHAFSYTEQDRLKSLSLSRGDGSLLQGLPGIVPSTWKQTNHTYTYYG